MEEFAKKFASSLDIKYTVKLPNAPLTNNADEYDSKTIDVPKTDSNTHISYILIGTLASLGLVAITYSVVKRKSSSIK